MIVVRYFLTAILVSSIYIDCFTFISKWVIRNPVELKATLSNERLNSKKSWIRSNNWNADRSLVKPYNESFSNLEEGLFWLRNVNSKSQRDIQLFTRMALTRNSTAKLSDEDWIKLVQICLSHSLIDDAVIVSYEILEREIPFASKSMTRLVELLCDRNRFTKVIELLDRALSAGYCFSVHNFSPALKRSGSAKQAMKILQRMHYAGINTNVISYTSAIKSCEGTGDWESALELLETMKALGVEPNEITYCCLMSVAARGNAGGIAFNVLRDMMANNIEPNQLCYGTALNACAKSGMWNEVEVLLKELRIRKIGLQQSVLNGVINLCRNKDPLSRSRDNSGDTSNKFGDAKNVTFIYNSNQSHSYSLEQMLPWQRAMYLLLSQRLNVEDRSESLYTMVLDVLESHYQYEALLELFKFVDSDGMVSRSSIGYAIRASAHLGDAGMSLALLDRARRENIDTPHFYNVTITILDWSRRYEDANRVLKQVVEKVLSHGFDSNIDTKKSTAPQVGAVAMRLLPTIWTTRNVLSHGLQTLTANFSQCFTKVENGRLAPNPDVEPFIADLAYLLHYAVQQRNIRLSPYNYPIANKLLLDRGDYGTARSLLNQTLYISSVNSSILYEFAVRSLTNNYLQPTGIGLLNVTAFLADLCCIGKHKLAADLAVLSLKRVGMTLSATANSPSNAKGYDQSSYFKARLTKSSKITNSSTKLLQDERVHDPYLNIGVKSRIDNITKHDRSRSHENGRKRNAKDSSLRKGAEMLYSFLCRARQIVDASYLPDQAFISITQTFRNIRVPDLMLNVYRDASNLGKVHNKVKDNTVYALARSKDYWDKAIEIVKSLEEIPSLYMLTNAVIACDNGNDWEQAIYWLNQIEQNGYNLTTVAVTSAISACASCGRADEALLLLDNMLQRGIQANVWTFNAAIAACSKQQRWRDALAVFESMRRYAFDGSDRSDFAIIDYSSHDDHFREESIFTGLNRDSSSVVTINSLIEVLGSGGQDFLVDEVYAEALLVGAVEPFKNIDQGYIDLHSHSVHMAKAAIRYAFALMLESESGTGDETTNGSQNLAKERSLIVLKMQQFLLKLPFLKDNAQKLYEKEVDSKKEINSEDPTIGTNDKKVTDNLVKNGKSDNNLVIIIGKGKKLEEAVVKYLSSEFNPPITAVFAKGNRGRLIVTARELATWINAHRIDFC